MKANDNTYKYNVSIEFPYVLRKILRILKSRLGGRLTNYIPAITRIFVRETINTMDIVEIYGYIDSLDTDAYVRVISPVSDMLDNDFMNHFIMEMRQTSNGDFMNQLANNLPSSGYCLAATTNTEMIFVCTG